MGVNVNDGGYWSNIGQISPESPCYLLIAVRYAWGSFAGSLITVNYALEQGKAVYAVPGAVNDTLSRGCHKLIFDGAGIAYCPEVIISELGLDVKRSGSNKEKKNLGLERDLDMVYSCLDLRPKMIDEIIRETGFSGQEVSRILLELTLMGLAEEIGRHHYVRIK